MQYSLEYKNKNTNSITFKKIKNSLKNSSHEKKDAYYDVLDICVLPNNFLLVSNYRTLSVFNDKYKLIKSINAIDNKSFRASGIACDSSKGQIYISDHLTDQIIMTDLNLNKITSTKPSADNCNKVNSIESPCFYKNKLFVAYRLNKQIKRFNEDLYFEKSFELDYQPAQIKIANNIACVKPDEKNSLYFYDIETFKLKRTFNNGLARISQINENFFEYCFDSKKIYCYSEDGELSEIIDISRLGIKNYSDGNFENFKWNGNLVYFNSNLVLSTQKAKKFIKFF